MHKQELILLLYFNHLLQNKYLATGVDTADSQEQKALGTPQPQPLDIDLDLDRGQTPERITFSNLAGAVGSSDQEDHPSEMDEDEWTDRNFGASAAECDSSDDLSDLRYDNLLKFML